MIYYSMRTEVMLTIRFVFAKTIWLCFVAPHESSPQKAYPFATISGFRKRWNNLLSDCADVQSPNQLKTKERQNHKKRVKIVKKLKVL